MKSLAKTTKREKYYVITGRRFGNVKSLAKTTKRAKNYVLTGIILYNDLLGWNNMKKWIQAVSLGNEWVLFLSVNLLFFIGYSL